MLKPQNEGYINCLVWFVHWKQLLVYILSDDVICSVGFDCICILSRTRQTAYKPSHRPLTRKIATGLRSAAVAACFDCSALPRRVITRNYLSRQATFRVEAGKHGPSMTASFPTGSLPHYPPASP